ncbi:MAG: hypothetical protein Q4D98_12975 [Planctomycetia bacterium]|nr:hypothetical protein [Planctomycetia bacterium]
MRLLSQLRRIPFFRVLPFLLLLAVLGLLYAVGPEAGFVVRFAFAVIFSVAFGFAFYLMIRIPDDLPTVGEHVDFGRAIREAKNAAKYFSVPGLKRKLRKEAIPSAILGLILLVLGTIFGPFQAPEILLPDFSEMVVKDMFEPYLFLADDTQAILAPPTLSAETEQWRERIPDRKNTKAVWKIYRNLFEGNYREAVELGHLALGDPEETDAATIRLALGQALLLAGDYEKAADTLGTPDDAPTTFGKYQAAIAMAYAGRLKPARLFFDSMEAAPEGIPSEQVAHWKLLLQILRGENPDGVREEYGRLWNDARKAYFRMSGQAEETETVTRASDEQAQNTGEANQNFVDQFAMLSNNQSVLQVLSGEYDKAVMNAEAVKTLGNYFMKGVARTKKTQELCAWNTQGVALCMLGKRPQGENEETASEEKPREKTTVEKMLETSPLPTECFQNAEAACTALGLPAESPYVILVAANQLRGVVRQDFSTPSLPQASRLQEQYADKIQRLRDIQSGWEKEIQDGLEPRDLPAWGIAVQDTLWWYYTRVEGREKVADRNFQMALDLCSAKLGGKNTLPEIAANTRSIEAAVFGRFATDNRLGKLDETQSRLKKYTVAAAKILPRQHPLLVRLQLQNGRVAMLKKQWKTARTHLANAEEILKKAALPTWHPLRLERNKLQGMVDAIQAEEPEKRVEIFDSLRTEYTRTQGEKSLEMAKLCQDFGFVYQMCKEPEKAEEAYREALATYQGVFGADSRHQWIRNVEKILNTEEK